MGKLKKLVVCITILMLCVILTGCDILFSGLFPSPEAHRYYATLEEAILASEAWFRVNDAPAGFPTTGEITRLIKNDGNAFFIIINPEGRPAGWVDIFMFYTRLDEYGNTQFSRILWPRRIVLDTHMWWHAMIDMDEIGEIRFSVAEYRLRNHTWESIGAGEHISQRPAWGISQTERVHNLRIEGQPVTEVIEFEFNGERIFFWYFEDLETDKSPIFYAEDFESWNVNVGEMEICMGDE